MGGAALRTPLPQSPAQAKKATGRRAGRERLKSDTSHKGCQLPRAPLRAERYCCCNSCSNILNLACVYYSAPRRWVGELQHLQVRRQWILFPRSALSATCRRQEMKQIGQRNEKWPDASKRKGVNGAYFETPNCSMICVPVGSLTQLSFFCGSIVVRSFLHMLAFARLLHVFWLSPEILISQPLASTRTHKSWSFLSFNHGLLF